MAGQVRGHAFIDAEDARNLLQVLVILRIADNRQDIAARALLLVFAKYNEYLKEIAKILGIEKRVTSHLARHTFATTVTYANGVSIETISKMLGHTKLSTTQIYARIVDQTISREMDKLSETLSGTSFSLSGGESEAGETDASTEIATATDSSVSASSTPNI